MRVVGFGLGLQMAVEKNQKNPSIFALSTVLVVDCHSMSKRWVFVPFGWLTPFFIECWRYSMCLWGGSVWLGWREKVKVSFWSVLPVFLFVIPTSFHACFFPFKGTHRCSIPLRTSWGSWLCMEQVFCLRIVVFSGLGTFCLMWVASFATASNTFLSVVVVPFDTAFYWECFDTFGWAWQRLIASAPSFLVTMVRGEHGWVVSFVCIPTGFWLIFSLPSREEVVPSI